MEFVFRIVAIPGRQNVVAEFCSQNVEQATWKQIDMDYDGMLVTNVKLLILFIRGEGRGDVTTDKEMYSKNLSE